MPALEAALYGGHVAEGPPVAELERRSAKEFPLPPCLAVSSGTAALQLALILAGVGPGDDVISTPITAEPTNMAIRHAGAPGLGGRRPEERSGPTCARSLAPARSAHPAACDTKTPASTAPPPPRPRSPPAPPRVWISSRWATWERRRPCAIGRRRLRHLLLRGAEARLLSADDGGSTATEARGRPLVAGAYVAESGFYPLGARMAEVTLLTRLGRQK